MIQVIPCECKYWEDEELPFKDFEGQANFINGILSCVECGRKLEIEDDNVQYIPTCEIIV